MEWRCGVRGSEGKRGRKDGPEDAEDFVNFGIPWEQRLSHDHWIWERLEREVDNVGEVRKWTHSLRRYTQRTTYRLQSNNVLTQVGLQEPYTRESRSVYRPSIDQPPL